MAEKDNSRNLISRRNKLDSPIVNRIYSPSRSPRRPLPIKDPRLPDPGLDMEGRASLLDAETLHSGRASMRGMMTIFWVFLACQSVMQLMLNWRLYGVPMTWALGRTCFSDIAGFISLELALMALSLLVYPVNLLKDSTLSFIVQISVIFGPMFAVWWRKWHAIQGISFLVHSLAMSMKIHSYLAMQDTKASFASFLNFLLSPSIVYSLRFPRTTQIRPLFLLSKVVGLIISGLAMYLTVENLVFPYLQVGLHQAPLMTLIETYIRLFPPLFATAILMFIFTFECFCNILAEITYHADRHFYADWWNR